MRPRVAAGAAAAAEVLLSWCCSALSPATLFRPSSRPPMLGHRTPTRRRLVPCARACSWSSRGALARRAAGWCPCGASQLPAARASRPLLARASALRSRSAAAGTRRYRGTELKHAAAHRSSTSPPLRPGSTATRSATLSRLTFSLPKRWRSSCPPRTTWRCALRESWAAAHL